MIQRIQSLFLFIVFDFQALLLLLPVSEFAVEGKPIISFFVNGFQPEGVILQNLFFTTLILILTYILMAIPLIAIFLYKNRIMQMRLCIVNFILLIGFQALLLWFCWNTGNELKAVTGYKISLIFPLISAILSYLAFLSIRRDEKLIRSIDRIR
jgi:hypothetical protein